MSHQVKITNFFRPFSYPAKETTSAKPPLVDLTAQPKPIISLDSDHLMTETKLVEAPEKSVIDVTSCKTTSTNHDTDQVSNVSPFKCKPKESLMARILREQENHVRLMAQKRLEKIEQRKLESINKKTPKKVDIKPKKFHKINLDKCRVYNEILTDIGIDAVHDYINLDRMSRNQRRERNRLLMGLRKALKAKQRQQEESPRNSVDNNTDEIEYNNTTSHRECIELNSSEDDKDEVIVLDQHHQHQQTNLDEANDDIALQQQ